MNHPKLRRWTIGEVIYVFFPFFSFCECVFVCVCVWFCLYSFVFTTCPRVPAVRSLLFCFLFLSMVFRAFYHWWMCFLVWLLSSFFLSFYYFKKILIIIFYFNNLYYFISFRFILFYFMFFILSFFFSLYYSDSCGWQSLGALPTHQGCASEVGEPSLVHWTTRDIPTPCNIKRWKSPRNLHLNGKIQLHSTTSKLQCWTPYAKQQARKTGTQPHPLEERLPKIIIKS